MMDVERDEAIETIFDRIDDARRSRDAAARLCARALISNDMESAQWQARSFQSYSDQVEALTLEMNQLIPARK